MLILNKSGKWIGLEGRLVGPGDTTSISLEEYEVLKEAIDSRINSGALEIVATDDSTDVTEESSQEVGDSHQDDDRDVKSPDDGSEPNNDEPQEPTLIGAYLEDGMHWKRLEKEIEDISSVEEIELLIKEAVDSGLEDGHVALRLLNERLNALSKSD